MSPHDQGAGCIWLTRLLPDLAAFAGSCISVLPSAGDACAASLAPGRLKSGGVAPLRRHQSVGILTRATRAIPLVGLSWARPLLSGLDLERSPEQTGGPSPFGAVAGGAGGYKRGLFCPCCSATARPYGDHSQPGAWVGQRRWRRRLWRRLARAAGAMAGLSPGLSSKECQGAQSRQVRPEEAQEPSSGAAKGGRGGVLRGHCQGKQLDCAAAQATRSRKSSTLGTGPQKSPTHTPLDGVMVTRRWCNGWVARLLTPTPRCRMGRLRGRLRGRRRGRPRLRASVRARHLQDG